MLFTNDYVKNLLMSNQEIFDGFMDAYEEDRKKGESLSEDHQMGDISIEKYVNDVYVGNDEAKQKLIKWISDKKVTNMTQLRDVSVRDMENKAKEFGLSVKHFPNESLEEYKPRLTQKPMTRQKRIKFITLMVDALSSEKFGYTRTEANDIALKRAEDIDSDGINWQLEPIETIVRRELSRILPKKEYEDTYGIS